MCVHGCLTFSVVNFYRQSLSLCKDVGLFFISRWPGLIQPCPKENYLVLVFDIFNLLITCSHRSAIVPVKKKEGSVPTFSRPHHRCKQKPSRRARDLTDVADRCVWYLGFQRYVGVRQTTVLKSLTHFKFVKTDAEKPDAAIHHGSNLKKTYCCRGRPVSVVCGVLWCAGSPRCQWS